MDSHWGSLGAQGTPTWTGFAEGCLCLSCMGPMPGTTVTIHHRNADSTPTRISSLTFLSLLVLPGRLWLLSSPRSAHWAQVCSFYWHKSTLLTSRGSECCLLSVCVSSQARPTGTSARELNHLLPPLLFLSLICSQAPMPRSPRSEHFRRLWEFRNNICGGLLLFSCLKVFESLGLYFTSLHWSGSPFNEDLGQNSLTHMEQCLEKNYIVHCTTVVTSLAAASINFSLWSWGTQLWKVSHILLVSWNLWYLSSLARIKLAKRKTFVLRSAPSKPA